MSKYELDLSKIRTDQECSILARAIKSGLIISEQNIYIDKSNEMYEQMKRFKKEVEE